MSDDEINDYISGLVQSSQFDLLAGNISAALSHIISGLSNLEETSDHPLKQAIVERAQAGQLETLEQVETFLKAYL